MQLFEYSGGVRKVQPFEVERREQRRQSRVSEGSGVVGARREKVQAGASTTTRTGGVALPSYE